MTDQTSETTPDGLDVAAVRERVCPDKACSAATHSACKYPGWRLCLHRPAPVTTDATEGEA